MTKLVRNVFGAAVSAAVVLNEACAWAVSSVVDPQKGMTLWEVIKAGGVVIWVLLFLSTVAGAIIIYCFKVLRVEHFSPKDFAEKAMEKIDAHDFDGLKKMVKEKDSLIPQMIEVGLSRRSKGRVAVKESMELYAQSEVNKLWQLLGYLADIATIAPLIGLFGTVLGIIQAFSAFSQNTMALKLGVLAHGVSLALVATAGGLVVAIPVMMFYSYFKPRVQQIVTDIEFIANDITENITRHI